MVDNSQSGWVLCSTQESYVKSYSSLVLPSTEPCTDKQKNRALFRSNIVIPCAMPWYISTTRKCLLDTILWVPFYWAHAAYHVRPFLSRTGLYAKQLCIKVHSAAAKNKRKVTGHKNCETCGEKYILYRSGCKWYHILMRLGEKLIIFVNIQIVP